MYDFSYQKPASLADAVKLLAGDPEAKALAGGMTYIPVLKMRLAKPTVIVDLAKLGLTGIKVGANSVTIGAMTTHATVTESAELRAKLPALAALAGMIGDEAVRHRGTIGGSIANNDPAADYPAAALALGATIKTNKRSIKADDFFTGMFSTALEQDETHHRGRIPGAGEGGLREVPQSRLALCDRRRVRREVSGRRARRGDRGRAGWRVPPDRDGEGAVGEFLARRRGWHQDAG